MDEVMIWGKTGFDRQTNDRNWLPLTQHLKDSGAAADYLWTKWLSPSLRELIAAPFGGLSNGLRVVRFLGAVHDIGKATPAFAVQARRHDGYLLDQMARNGLRVDPRLPPEDSRKLRHALAGHLIVHDWLITHGWSSGAAHQLAVIVGGHHGLPPEPHDLSAARGMPHLLGDESWTSAQYRLLDEAAHGSQTTELWSAWATTRIPQPVQVALTGLVITADWIASNAELFPLLAQGQDPHVLPKAKERARHAWETLRLPPAWRPAAGNSTTDERLFARFGIAAKARPVQAAAVAAAESMPLPGLMVVEAAMGEGKTEAALLAAEILAQRSGSGGCFVALPTQATTDGMFDRVLNWLSRLPDMNSPAHSIVLAHGKSRLNTTYRDLFRLGKPDDVGVDEYDEPAVTGPSHSCEIQAYVDAWTTGRKKGALADFVVGTIDQLLFIALKARHLALRHLGIARKVVIVDEVHAYDTYMSIYLARALEWLGAYGIPVILLSATLPPERRRELCDAYRAGLASRRPAAPEEHAWGQWSGAPAATAASTGPERTTPDEPLHYPVITVVGESGISPLPVPASDARLTQVVIETLPDDLGTLVDTLETALADGGCALVVRNTVRRAQQTAAALAEHFGTNVHLVHARFMGHDRMDNDRWLRDTFGPPGGARPGCAIVVGTQVVEQSLDIDFDLLITDLAPIDLMLQRVGRLHRHRRGDAESDRPERLRTPRCLVAGVKDWQGGPPQPDPGSRRIYGQHLLYRSAWPVLRTARSRASWSLPHDIPRLVAEVYADDFSAPAEWHDALRKARTTDDAAAAQRRQKARTFLLDAPRSPGTPILGWLHASVGEADDAEGRAAVRDGDDSVEVLLLRRHTDGSLHLPEGKFAHNGRLIDPSAPPPASVAQALAGCSLRLPSWATAGSAGQELVNTLHENYFHEWQRDVSLRGQLLLILDNDGPTQLAGLTFTYDRTTGLEVRRHDA